MHEVDIRARQLLEHLTRRGRERLHVFPVALRIDRIESERRLAGARRTGDHDQFTPRQAQLEVLQIVLPGTFDVDVRFGLHVGKRTPYPIACHRKG